jgi:hypothetical protein
MTDSVPELKAALARIREARARSRSGLVR